MDSKMEPVINFTNELFTLVENKIPISKAKMGAITKSAMKAIKFYKHVVQNVEKFILKCKPEYKIPGLYVIDSIVRQSRHQFGPEKDVFAPRFARNMEETFAHLFRCSQEDKSKIIRVLNLWQKNNVFAPEVIQPLFDLANPDHPVHQAFMQQQQQQNQQGDMSNGISAPRESPSQKEEQGGSETLNAMNIQKFQFQQLMMQQQQVDPNMESMKFNNQLLDYDYGSDGDEDKGEPVQQHQMQMSNVLQYPYNFTKCLEDPNVLKHLQNIKQMDVQRYLNDMPGASNTMIDPQQSQTAGITLTNINNLRGPPPIDNKDQDVELVGDIISAEVIPVSSRSPTPTRHKRRKSRSRSRDKNRYGRRRRSRSKSRSRSYSRSPRSKRRSSRDRAKEKEREVDRERKRKGLPDIKKEHLSVCSTTLWVGHLSKLVQQEELSDTFGKYGDIVSIDMIPPRGCAYIVMNRRQDAYKAMQSLKNHKMQNRAITISWAAGKGVKSKEWKDYFDQSLGVTYIPYSKLTHTTDFMSLEEGGMYDEDSMPAWVKEKIKQQNQPAVKDGIIMPQFFPAVDTSQPPPNASLLPTMPPFPMGARPMLMGPGLMGLGVPPPNMMLPGMLQIPPGLMGFPMAATAAATQQVMQGQQSSAGDDHMDIEMEDESNSKNEPMMQFYNQPPPMNMNQMMMSGNTEKQNESTGNNRMGNRNNRSQSREKDGRGDFRSRGPRDRNDRRSGQGDYNNRNSRWPNDSNGRERSRSRDGQNNFNRRQGHQSDLPGMMNPQMGMMDNDGMPSRQRNNDYGRDRDDYDRRGGGFNMRGGRGFNDMRGGRGGRGGQFQRGGMRGFHNNSFNDRGGNFHDRDQAPRGRGGRNWRDEENDRGPNRSFNRGDRGNFERKGTRWMDNQKNEDDWDNENHQQQPQSQQNPSEQQEQSSSFNDNGNGNGEGDYQHDQPPGTEESHRFTEEPTNEIPTNETFENHSQVEANNVPVVDSGGGNNDNPGNTTPLCDEAESKE